MSDTTKALTDFVQAWCKDAERQHAEMIRRNESSIRWYKNELEKKLTPAQRVIYRHEIRRLELEIAFA